MWTHRTLNSPTPPARALRGRRVGLVAALLGLVLLGFTTAPAAFHETGHRTMLRGFVVDENGSAVRNARVVFSRDGIVIASARTDIWGWYAVPIPAGAADVGRRIEVATRGQEGTFRFTATTDRARSVPVQYVNLVGGTVTTDRMLRFRVPFWIYPLAGLIALLVAAFSLEKWRRRRRRRSQRAGTPQPGNRKTSAAARPRGRRRR